MDLTELLKKRGKECCGCGACRNVCPKDAIEMKENREGFLVPSVQNSCIDCGLCAKTCPVLNPVYSNQEKPDCFAMTAAEEIRKRSSSGGFFTLLAEYVLKQGGIVFGAAWTPEWTVRQIGIEREEELDKLRLSKYIQGDTAYSYREAKQALQQGRQVLYTGLPCQIAGLYAALGNDHHPGLITMEVCCHGAPSAKVFHKYLHDNYPGQTVTSVKFRDKSCRDGSTAMSLEFSDGGKVFHLPKNDSFYAGFLPCMIMRKSCAVCPFSRLPRQADITVGDFWGCRKFDSSLYDGKGTSFVLANNHRGMEIVNRLKPDFTLWKEVPLDAVTKINKTILHPFAAHPGRKHFYSSLDLKPFNEITEHALTHHYDVGVVGLWYGINYGSILTYYALYELLRDLGHDPVMLPKPDKLWEKRFNAPDTIAQKFIWEHCNVFLPLQHPEDYYLFNEICDSFIVGSDVVWRYNICGEQVGHFFFLDWVFGNRRKIAYAASFGGPDLIGPPSYVEIAMAYLKKFDAVSVREARWLDILKANGIAGDAVMDPVFVCDRKIYEDAIRASSFKSSEKFIFSYFLQLNRAEDRISFLEKTAAQRKARIEICGNPNGRKKSEKAYGKYLLPDLSVEDWLAHISSCDCYIGDSYHGLCFALMYHRPFIIMQPPSAKSIERINCLLKLTGLEDRLVDVTRLHARQDQMINVLKRQIDWDFVDARIAEKAAFSRQWLQNALTMPQKPTSPNDIIIDDLRIKLAKCSAELERRRLSYRIPYFCTKCSKGIKCLRENGLLYTLRRIAEKLRHR